MNTDNAAAAEAGLNSLALDDGGVSERPLSDAAFDAPKVEGKPEAVEAKEPAKLSTREALEKALDEVEAKDKPKADDKPEAKAEDGKEAEKPAKARADDGKFAKADDAKADETAVKPKAERDGSEAGRQSEGRDTPHREPPARFLPEARAKWQNVPNEIKAEFHRVSQEYEREVTQYRQGHEEWQKLDKFAQHYGTQYKATVADALERFTAVDNLLHQKPLEGIREVLATVGITPQQYAQHVMQNPAQHAAPVQQPQPQTQQQAAPEIMGIKQELDSLKQELAMERAQSQLSPMIQKFADDHPDYEALQDAIATILKDGVIDRLYGNGLSPEQKLAQAYRMAGGSSPSQSTPELPVAHSEAETVPSSDAGTKSVRGAPSGGKDPTAKRFKSNRDAAEAALAELGI